MGRECDRVHLSAVVFVSGARQRASDEAGSACKRRSFPGHPTSDRVDKRSGSHEGHPTRARRKPTDHEGQPARVRDDKPTDHEGHPVRGCDGKRPGGQVPPHPNAAHGRRYHGIRSIRDTRHNLTQRWLGLWSIGVSRTRAPIEVPGSAISRSLPDPVCWGVSLIGSLGRVFGLCELGCPQSGSLWAVRSFS